MKLLTVIALSFICSVLHAQSVGGKILDAGGRPIAGAAVIVRGTTKGANTLADGSFRFDNLRPGKFTFQVSSTGFQSKDTSLILGQENILDLLIQLDTAEAELDEVVIVSSSRTNSRIEDLPTRVEVLGSEEVHEENGIKPGNIASLLGDIAGIQVQQTSAATGNADLRIQGLQGKYTQILRDGIPLFGGYAGSFSILQIPPLDLQQIELVKGASSTLYGGGAIAGMVNLVSKKPRLGKPEASFTINRSTLQENNANLFFSGRNKNAGYTLFAGGTLQNEVDVDKDGFSDVPSVKSVFIHPRLFLYGKSNSTVAIGYTLNYEDRRGGDMLVLDHQANSAHQFFISNKSLRNTADISWEKQLANEASFTAKASTSFLSRDISSNVFGMGGNQLSWYSEFAYAKKTTAHSVVAGLNFSGEDFSRKLPDSSALPNETLSTLGIFIQDDWKLAQQLTLQAGLRTDFTSSYGTFILPRLSFMYKPDRVITMRLGAGFGYKTPSLFNSEVDERDYHYLQGYFTGIKAERSFGANFDINFKKKVGEWDMTLNQTFFYNNVSDPILLRSGPPYTKLPFSKYSNAAGELRSTGSETYVQLRQDELEIYLGYVYTHALRNYDLITSDLPLIARHKFATVLAYEFSSKFRAGVESAYTGAQSLNDGSKTQPYLFTALMVRYTFGKLSAVLNCENLFDYRQNKTSSVVIAPFTNPSFKEIWAPIDGRVVNLSLYLKLK